MEWTYIEEDDAEPTVFGYLPNALSSKQSSDMLQWLKENPHYQGTVVDDELPIPREQVWYQKNNQYFCPSWKGNFARWTSQKYDNFLDLFQQEIMDIAKKELENLNHQMNINIDIPDINSCLINRYRHGLDSIKPHRDNIESFGRDPTIIGISLGDTRTLHLHRVVKKTDKKTHNHLEFPLENNSIFIMAGSSQEKYYHSRPKIKQATVGERFSLTFREWKYHQNL